MIPVLDFLPPSTHDGQLPEMYIPEPQRQGSLPPSRSYSPVGRDERPRSPRPLSLRSLTTRDPPIVQLSSSHLIIPTGGPPVEIGTYTKGNAAGSDDRRECRSGKRVRWHEPSDQNSDSDTHTQTPRDVASKCTRGPLILPSRAPTYRPRSPSPPSQSPLYVTVNQTWNESIAAWTPEANVGECKFVVYRRRRAFADSERVFTLVQFADRGLLNAVRSACPSLDGLYAHDGMVSLNLLYPHINKLRNAAPSDELSAFLEFLEDEFEPHRMRIEALVADGQIKYEYLWAVYKPGTKLCVRVEGTDHIGAIVDSAEYLSSTPGPYFVVKYRTLEWTGEKMYWTLWAAAIAPFEGCEYITAVGPRLATEEQRATMTDSGRKFLQYVGSSVRHVQITGTMTTNAARDVSAKGRGMVDPVSYTKFFPTRRAGLHLLRPFEHPVTKEGMPEDMLWLLPATLECYSFVAHAWGVVRVADIEPVVYDEKAWDRVVVHSNEKGMMRALVEQQSSTPATVLLHGSTGLGKTFTVEALAEALRRPLYPIASTDHNAPLLGSAVDFSLDMAERWNAIMLLEDVDSHCVSQDAHQRMLPDCLLRALESRRSGALFLTARRRPALPLPIMYRITLAVEYNELDFMQRLQIWEYCINDVLENAPREELLMQARSRERPVLHASNMHEFATKQFNASSIKSIVQTAHALAISRPEPLSVQHFRDVIYEKNKFLREAGLLENDDAEDEDEDSEPSETD